MNLADLIRALVDIEPIRARQWVLDADDAHLDWNRVPAPRGLSARELAVAAGIVEVLAQRRGQQPPGWTADIAAAPEPVWLVRLGRELPRTRQMCIDHGPEPLRRRNVFAPPEFLTAA